MILIFILLILFSKIAESRDYPRKCDLLFHNRLKEFSLFYYLLRPFYYPHIISKIKFAFSQQHQGTLRVKFVDIQPFSRGSHK